MSIILDIIFQHLCADCPSCVRSSVRIRRSDVAFFTVAMGIEHIVEHFAQRADHCVTLADLTALLADAGREVGFDYVAITLCDNLRQSAPRRC